VKKPAPEPGKGVGSVTTFKVGHRTYERKYVDCGKPNCGSCNTASGSFPSHGPYWYLCVPRAGKWTRIYLGKECDTTRYITPDGQIDWQAIKNKPKRRRLAKHTPTPTGADPPAPNPADAPENAGQSPPQPATPDSTNPQGAG